MTTSRHADGSYLGDGVTPLESACLSESVDQSTFAAGCGLGGGFS